MNRFGFFAAMGAALLTPCLLSTSRADTTTSPAAPTSPPTAATPAPAAAPATAPAGGGIQWFTRLKDGLAEASRTGRPILYLSAAPSCGGVPGIW